jgi:hypothetical protein
MDAQRGIAASYVDRGAGRDIGQGAIDQYVPAPVEAEAVKVDSRRQ